MVVGPKILFSLWLQSQKDTDLLQKMSTTRLGIKKAFLLEETSKQ